MRPDPKIRWFGSYHSDRRRARPDLCLIPHRGREAVGSRFGSSERPRPVAVPAAWDLRGGRPSCPGEAGAEGARTPRCRCPPPDPIQAGLGGKRSGPRFSFAQCVGGSVRRTGTPTYGSRRAEPRTPAQRVVSATVRPGTRTGRGPGAGPGARNSTAASDRTPSAVRRARAEGFSTVFRTATVSRRRQGIRADPCPQRRTRLTEPGAQRLERSGTSVRARISPAAPPDAVHLLPGSGTRRVASDGPRRSRRRIGPAAANGAIPGRPRRRQIERAQLTEVSQVRSRSRHCLDLADGVRLGCGSTRRRVPVTPVSRGGPFA